MAERVPLEFGTVIVIGGGCYGSYHVRQLQRAAAAGVLRIGNLLVVDRDARCRVAIEPREAGRLGTTVVVAEWQAFLAQYLAAAADAPRAHARDALVPSPLMPHLLHDWIVARARARAGGRSVVSTALPDGLPVPWQRAGADGTHYASFATWLCPINCIEPARCPHTRATRDWSMPVMLRRHVEAARATNRATAGPYVFHSTHRAYGVGMIDVAAVVAADADLARRLEEGDVEALVATVSHCHGAVGRLCVGEIPHARPVAP